MLHICAKVNDKDTAGRVLEGFVDLGVQPRDGVNATEAGGVSALMVAAKYGSVGVAGMLWRAGANVNLQDQEGRTALFYTTWEDDKSGKTFCNAKLYDALVDKAGADAGIADHNGRKAQTPKEVQQESARPNAFAGLQAMLGQ